MVFSFPDCPKFKHEISEAEKNAFRIRRPMIPSEWVESNFILTTAYATPGKLKLRLWQVEPINAIMNYHVVMFCGSVQTGKSLLAEGCTGWIIDNLPMNSMICYAKADTVKSVFDERLKPMVQEVPAIRKYWNGDDDRLTQKKITLSHMILRIASAENKNDIATYSAGYVYASEVSKYPKKDFDQIRALFGRQEEYRRNGVTRAVIESSPDHEGDPLHRVMYTRGVLNLDPHVRCPHCGKWQVLIDSQIKELPDKNTGEYDHDPERIREEDAAVYECEFCRKEISERDRSIISKSVVWAAVGEEILADGTVKNRKKAKRVSFRWNRLVDVTFKYSECLARFFSARQSVDPATLKTYQNEDMAVFAKKESRQFSSNWLMQKRLSYSQYGETSGYPENIIVLTIGMDTQDDGFYYSIRGWAQSMESYLIKHNFVECKMTDDKYKNRDEIVKLVQEEIIVNIPKRLDGACLSISAGFIDRGGHRPKDVDYLCSRINFLNPYVGSVRKNAPLLEKSKTKTLFNGNTENLSKIVETYSEGELWHLPEDVTEDYCSQFLRQYWQDKIDSHGNSITEYMHGGKDHLRDCENLNIAASLYLGLEQRLFNPDQINKITKQQAGEVAPKKTKEEDIEGGRSKPIERAKETFLGNRNYLGNRYGRM